MADYFNRLENFYKILSPVDMYGKTKQVGTKNLTTIEKDVYENYLVGTYSGEEIINNLKPLKANGKGIYFNTLFQAAGSTQTEYLDPEYWKSIGYANAAGGGTPPAPPTNFYAEVCKGETGDTNPVDFSINLLRSAYFSADPKLGGRAILPIAIRGSDAVELFLNAMPTIFPSMMVPYFEVEFDFPVKLPTQLKKDDRPYDANFLNRPSLLRFLLGSIDINQMPLTDADRALVTTKRTISRKGKTQDSYSTGMELFTAPQTLTNYDSLRADGRTRVRNVKPFLPPATLTGGSLSLVNAGGGAIVDKKASIQFTIHDKSRVSEFSEFFRIVQGTHDVTAWITYGWLAPRTVDSSTDFYSKFINETMLKKQAFNITNLSFSFDAYGQAAVTMELLQQGVSFIDTVQLTVRHGHDLFTKLETIENDMKYIDQAKTVINDLEGPVSAFKIVKEVKSTLDQGNPVSLTDDEKKKVDETITLLETENKKNKLDSVLYEDLRKGLVAIKEIADLYDKKKNKLREVSRSYSFQKFMACINRGSPDPFLPESFKKNITIDGVDYTVFKDELLQEMEAIKKPPKTVNVTDSKGINKAYSSRRIASFGKVFSVFCLPPILGMAYRNGIEEVQVNFYQLNERCGPLSLHNVAEFPIDMDILMEQFAAESEKVGGELMTLRSFLQFVNTAYIRENRAIGYGMTSFYEGYTNEKPNETPKKDSQTFDFEKKQKEWGDKYGILKQPNLQVKLETLPKRTVDSKVDLLEQLRNPENDISPKIMKIHVYDAHLHPYDNIKQRILKNNAGSYVAVPEEYLKNELVELKDFNKYDKTTTIGDVQIIGVSDDPLVEHVQHVLPTLHVGANSTLITSIGVSSKMDAQLGTALSVPTTKGLKVTNTLSPNGLNIQGTNLPIRLTNASVSMTSLGCPIADLYQHFYIDFGTGTTMDNIYVANAVSHNFGPGKFDTSWSFVPADGYPTFFGAKSIDKLVEEKLRAGSAAPPTASKAAPPPTTPTPPPPPKPKAPPKKTEPDFDP